MKKLSKENKSKLLLGKNHIYKWNGDIPNPSYISGYHCKNWVFYMIENKEGAVIAIDTYWYASGGDNKIEVTDNNIDLFEYKFNKNEYKQISYYEADRYNERDLIKNIAARS